jgi:hypothetical protein
VANSSAIWSLSNGRRLSAPGSGVTLLLQDRRRDKFGTVNSARAKVAVSARNGAVWRFVMTSLVLLFSVDRVANAVALRFAFAE